jgi:hypothetical protein
MGRCGVDRDRFDQATEYQKIDLRLGRRSEGRAKYLPMKAAANAFAASGSASTPSKSTIFACSSCGSAESFHEAKGVRLSGH